MILMETFRAGLKKEFFIYLIMLFLLALISHSDLLSSPSERFIMMMEKGNYFHPFLYAFVIYSILFIIRKILDVILGVFEKKT